MAEVAGGTADTFVSAVSKCCGASATIRMSRRHLRLRRRLVAGTSAARSWSLTSVVCLVFDVLQHSDVTDEKRWQWWNICISGSVRLDLQQSCERAFTLLQHPVAAFDVLWFHFLSLKVCWATFNKSSQPSNIQWQRTDVLQHEAKLLAVCLTLVTSSADLYNPWLYLYKY